MLFSIEGHQAKQKQKRKKTRKTKERLTQGRKLQSHRPNWNTSLEASQGTTETKANHWSMSCPCYTVYRPADRAVPYSADKRQEQSMMPKTERYTDILKQAQKQKV